MMTPMRYLFLVLGIIFSLHFILSFSHKGYQQAVVMAGLTPSNIKQKLPTVPRVPPYKIPLGDEYFLKHNVSTPLGRRANATFVILARNSDINGVTYSIKQIEDRFNSKFNYPYVFLNDEEFSPDFKERVRTITSSELKFGLISKENWNQPDFIDEEKARKAREKLVADGVIYGGSVPYRNMCRFNSGFFFRQPLLMDYKYYWRVEPDVKFLCDIDYDPFVVMEDQNKVYGFTMSLYDYEATLPTLWDTVKKFAAKYPEYIPEGNAMPFISDDGGETYNLCHFWSNFEIADLDFWRSEAYLKFFDYLDKTGGFYYERWGDAPIHSIGAALLAKKEQIHFFHDIGYRHEPFQHCPQGVAHKRGKCYCDPKQNFDYEWYSCLNRYDKMFFKRP